MFDADFKRIREVSKDMGCFSWTTIEYQNAILQHLIDNRDGVGRGVVEVGCYKGGLSALLAFICKQFNWPFFAIDIDATAIESTGKLLDVLALKDNSTLFHGDLASFVSSVKLDERPALIILDGDHRYEAVIEDISNVYRLNQCPYAAVFHDFSLRHPTSGEHVDLAVKDSFGNRPIKMIGANMDGSGAYPTKENPSEDGHWWDVPGSEGAIIELPEIASLRSSAPRSKAAPSLFSRVLRRLRGS